MVVGQGTHRTISRVSWSYVQTIYSTVRPPSAHSHFSCIDSAWRAVTEMRIGAETNYLSQSLIAVNLVTCHSV